MVHQRGETYVISFEELIRAVGRHIFSYCQFSTASWAEDNKDVLHGMCLIVYFRIINVKDVEKVCETLTLTTFHLCSEWRLAEEHNGGFWKEETVNISS
jgi:hypothetical protein